MIKIQKYSTIVAFAGLLAMIIPLAVNAQVQNRLKNAEVNRDYRNIQLKRTASSTRPMMATSTLTRSGQEIAGGNRSSIVLPKWFFSPMSPWKNNPNLGTTSNRLPESFVKFAAETKLEDHRGLKETRIDKFALLHGNLINELDKSFDQLKAIRIKLADRIAMAEQSGRTMTDAKNLLILADAKIAVAEKAVSEVRSYVPPAIVSAKTTTSESTNVALEKPREMGKKAIEALKDAKEALNEVVTGIAHSMGLKNRQATSTTP